MQYKNYTDPIINNYRRNEKGIKQSKRIDSEVHKIVNSKVALSEIPDEEQVLKIDGYDETKVKEVALSDKQFRVDYTNGFIYFSPSQDGATVDVSYFGLGVTYFPASRVWLEVDGENNVEKTLADVQGDIAEAKKLSASQEQLKKDIDEQGGKLKEIIDEVQRVDLTEIEKTAKGAKQAEDSLKSATNEAEAKIANINETKKQLDTSIQSAKDEGQSLNDKIKQSKANKAEIDGACEKLKQATNSVDGSVKKAQEAVSAIDEKVNTGNQIKDELDKSTQQANEASSTLSNAKQESNQANSELIASQKTADKTKTDLEALKSESTSLSSDLDEKNKQAKENIEGLKSQNQQAKEQVKNLQSEGQVAVEKKDSLSSENTKANQTISQIEGLIQSSTDLKQKLEEIIASGDLGKYVTDPKLQNILTAYATKDDLSKIDVTSQLVEYAKKSELPTSLSQLADDETHRLVTDTEKEKWNNPPNPDLSEYATKSEIESKAEKTDVPTKVSQLENDKKYIVLAQLIAIIKKRIDISFSRTFKGLKSITGNVSLNLSNLKQGIIYVKPRRVRGENVLSYPNNKPVECFLITLAYGLNSADSPDDTKDLQEGQQVVQFCITLNDLKLYKRESAPMGLTLTEYFTCEFNEWKDIAPQNSPTPDLSSLIQKELRDSLSGYAKKEELPTLEEKEKLKQLPYIGQLNEMLDKKLGKSDKAEMLANPNWEDDKSYTTPKFVSNAVGILNGELMQSLSDGLEEELKKKVDKVSGKGLSANDYTNEDKAKVASIPEYLKKKDLQSELANKLLSDMVVEEFGIITDNSGNYEFETQPFKEFIKGITQDMYNLQATILGEDKIKEMLQGYLPRVEVRDDLTSTFTDSPLSANQGRILNDKKVDKVDGKTLSTNDFTNDYKNTIDTIKNTALAITSSSSDLNTLTKAGFYSCRGCSNRPANGNSYATLIVSKADTTTDGSQTDTVQFYLDMDNNAFIRNSIDKSGTWTDWVQLGGHATKVLTESEYNGLSNKDANTLYFIK